MYRKRSDISAKPHRADTKRIDTFEDLLPDRPSSAPDHPYAPAHTKFHRSRIPAATAAPSPLRPHDHPCRLGSGDRIITMTRKRDISVRTVLA